MQIYKITNLINGKIYIGLDSSDRSYYYGSGKLIKRALKKYGKENFLKDIIMNCSTREQLNKWEIYWIKHFREYGYDLYNLTKGGEGCLGYVDENRVGKTLVELYGEEKAEEIKQKMSEALKGRPSPMKGRKQSEETRKKMKENHNGGMKGINHTKESCEKMSKSHKGLPCNTIGRKWINNGTENKIPPIEDLDKYLNEGWVLGSIQNKEYKPLTEEHKQKLKENSKDRIRINNGSITKYVKKEYLSDYLNEGWIKGSLQKPSDETKNKMSKAISNKRWINNGKENKYVDKEYLDDYLNNGWIKGMLNNYSEEVSKKISESAKDRKWINNGNENKKVKLHELDEYLDNGWKLGILSELIGRAKKGS